MTDIFTNQANPELDTAFTVATGEPNGAAGQDALLVPMAARNLEGTVPVPETDELLTLMSDPIYKDQTSEMFWAARAQKEQEDFNHIHETLLTTPTETEEEQAALMEDVQALQGMTPTSSRHGEDFLKRTAIEREAGEFLSFKKFADPITSRYFEEGELDSILDDTVMDRQETQLVTALMINKFMMENGERYKDESFGDTTLNFAARVFDPSVLRRAWATFDVDQLDILGSSIEEFTGKVRNSQGLERLELVDSFLQGVKTIDNSVVRNEVLNTLNDQSTLGDVDRYSEDIFSALDLTGYAKILTSPVKSVKSIFRILRLTGNRGEAANLAKEALEVKLKGGAIDTETTNGATSEALFSLVRADLAGDAELGVAGEVQRHLDQRTQNLTEILTSDASARYLTPDEMNKALESGQVDLARSLDGKLTDPSHIVDVKAVEDPLSKSVYYDTYIGNGPTRQASFANESEALSAGETMGFGKGEVIAVETEGGWYLKHRMTVTQKGFEAEEAKGLAPVQSKLANSKIQLGTDRARGNSQLAGNQAVRLGKQSAEIVNNFNSLAPNRKSRLHAWFTETQKQEKNLSLGEMEEFYDARGWTFEPKDAKAYVDQMVLEEADLLMKSAHHRWEFESKGYGVIRFNHGDTEIASVGKALEELDVPLNKASILDVNTGKIYKQGQVDKQVMETLMNDGVTLVKILDDTQIDEAARVSYAVVRKGGYSQSTLPMRLVQRTEGGRFVYENKLWMKQATHDGNARALYHFPDSADAANYVEPMNRVLELARDAAKTGSSKNIREIEAILATKFPDIGSWDKLQEMRDSGKISFDTKVEITKDGQSPTSSLERQAREEWDADFNDLSSSSRELVASRNWWYKTARGQERKTHPSGETTLLDPMPALQESISKSISLHTDTRYLESEMTRWISNYGNHLDFRKGESRTDIFSTAPWKRDSNLSEGEKTYAENIRAAVLRHLNTPTLDERAVDSAIGSTLEWADQSGKLGLGALLRKPLSNASAQGIAGTIKAVTARLALMLSPSQIILQTSMIPASIAISPKHGSQAVGLLLPMYVADRANRLSKTTNASNVVGKWVAKWFEEKTPMLGDLMKDIEEAGVSIVDAHHGDIAVGERLNSDVSAISGTVKEYAVRKASKILTVPFSESERLNKLWAFTTAWLENGGKALKKDEWHKVELRAESLSLNMSRTSNSNWQRGFTGAATVLTSHPIRTMEALMTSGAGLSKGERARFAIALGVIYGGGSYMMGLDEEVLSFYREQTGKELTFDDPLVDGTAKFLRSGIWGVLQEHAGFDVDDGRFNPIKNNLPVSFVRDVVFGEKSISSISPVTSMVGGLLEDTVSGMVLLQQTITGKRDWEDLPRQAKKASWELLKNFSGLSRTDRYFEIMKTGMYRSKDGTPMAFYEQDERAKAAMLQYLGQPMRLADSYDLMSDEKAIKRSLQRHAKASALLWSSLLNDDLDAAEQKNVRKDIRDHYRLATQNWEGEETEVLSKSYVEMLTKELRRQKTPLSEKTVRRFKERYGQSVNIRGINDKDTK